MCGKQHRLYLGNLSANISEEEIHRRLGEYGNIQSVEVKRREPLSFAYVNLEIHTDKLHKCFQEIGSQEWNGNHVKIQLAKESFLDRLARERNSVKPENTSFIQNVAVNEMLKHNTVLSNEFDSKSSHFEADVSRNNECTESSSKVKVPMFKGTKRAYSGTHKICAENQEKQSVLSHLKTLPHSESLNNASVINDIKEKVSDSLNNEVDYYTNKFKRKKKEETMETKNKIEANPVSDQETRRKQISDEKRLRSMREKIYVFNKQKQAVKAALSSIDSGCSKNKKIKFDSDNEEDIPQFSEDKHGKDKKRQTSLFDDDSSESENDIRIKKQFEGKKGQRLLELQTRYGNDERFRLDKRFQESSDDEDCGEKKSNTPEDNKEENDEKSRALQILENVLGHSVTNVSQKKSQHKNKVMVRFDPTKAEHLKFEIKENQEKPHMLKKKSIKQKQLEIGEGQGSTKDDIHVPTVSAEKFYKVTDQLKDTFKSKDKNETFSLRKLFGSNEEDEDDNDKEGEDSSKLEKHLSTSNSESRVKVKTKKKIKLGRNPFKYDSSDETEEEDSAKIKSAEVKQNVVKDDFFFQPDDERFKETILMVDEREGAENKQDFSLVRRELKRIARLKMRRYKKSKDFPKRNNNKFKKFNNKFKTNKKKNHTKFQNR